MLVVLVSVLFFGLGEQLWSDFMPVYLKGQSKPLVHTAQGVPMGTPYYMSPEQCQGHAVDARADVYSFGVICHELLTGKVPFSGDSTITTWSLISMATL